jgi:hypothetical protein
MGRQCKTHWINNKYMHSSDWKTRRKELGIDQRIILILKETLGVLVCVFPGGYWLMKTG